MNNINNLKVVKTRRGELKKRDEIKQNILKLLREDERCRNSDKWLIYRYLKDVQGIPIYMPFQDFERMVSFESVTRARRHVQNNDGMFLPSDPEVRRRRDISEESWIRWARKRR